MGDSIPLIVDISSDEEPGLDDTGRGGVGLDEIGDIDFDLISKLLDDCDGGNTNNNSSNSNKDNVGVVDVDGDGDDDDVVFVSEVVLKKPEKSRGGVLERRVVEEVNEDEDDDECVVLDGDPDKATVVVNAKVDNGGNGNDSDDDLEIISEKGEVACRDFPHARHLCAKFIFASTPHEVHCSQCHCYVCDSVAPCPHWGNGVSSIDHCHASDKEEYWKAERQNMQKGDKPAQVAQVTAQVTVPSISDSVLLEAIRHLQPAFPTKPNSVPQTQILRRAINHSTFPISSNISVPNLVSQSQIHQYALRVCSTLPTSAMTHPVSISSIVSGLNVANQRLQQIATRPNYVSQTQGLRPAITNPMSIASIVSDPNLVNRSRAHPSVPRAMPTRPNYVPQIQVLRPTTTHPLPISSSNVSVPNVVNQSRSHQSAPLVMPQTQVLRQVTTPNPVSISSIVSAANVVNRQSAPGTMFKRPAIIGASSNNRTPRGSQISVTSPLKRLQSLQTPVVNGSNKRKIGEASTNNGSVSGSQFSVNPPLKRHIISTQIFPANNLGARSVLSPQKMSMGNSAAHSRAEIHSNKPNSSSSNKLPVRRQSQTPSRLINASYVNQQTNVPVPAQNLAAPSSNQSDAGNNAFGNSRSISHHNMGNNFEPSFQPQAYDNPSSYILTAVQNGLQQQDHAQNGVVNEIHADFGLASEVSQSQSIAQEDNFQIRRVTEDEVSQSVAPVVDNVHQPSNVSSTVNSSSVINAEDFQFPEPGSSDFQFDSWFFENQNVFSPEPPFIDTGNFFSVFEEY